MNMTDQEFLSKIQALDRLLNSIAFSLTKNREDAGDLKQDTILKAYTYRTQFKEGTNFRAWVTIIMRNTFINAYRKKQVRRQVNNTFELMPDVHGNLTPRHNDGDERLLHNDIARHIDGLSKLYAIPFIMYVQGYTYVEIANFLGLPLGTLKSRIFGARVRLKEPLTGRPITKLLLLYEICYPLVAQLPPGTLNLVLP